MLNRFRDLVNRAVRRVPPWSLYILGAMYVGWQFWLAATGAMGPEPIKALEHAYGEMGLKLLVLGLMITPLRRRGFNLLRLRRAIGVLAFFLVLAHLLVWLVLDVQTPKQIWADIVKRPYITIGMAAFLLMLPLALTSNNKAVRRLGAAWNRLHKLTYLVAILGALHFVMLVKGLQFEPLAYLIVVIGLVALRYKSRSRPLVKVGSGLGRGQERNPQEMTGV